MKKFFSLLLVVCLVLAMPILSANATAAELIPMRYYMPGAATPQADIVTAAINEKLHADGVNIDFQPTYVPWDQWVNKINVMLSSGEEFELLHIMEDYVTTSIYAGRDALLPLNDLIDQYAPKMWDRFDASLWKSATVNGKVMTIPDNWRDNSGDGEGAWTYNKTKYDEFGLTIPTTVDEILATTAKLQQMWKDQDGITRYLYEHSDTRCPVALHRSYEKWPFYASQDGIFQVFQDGTAALYFGSEEFKKDSEFMNKAYTMGLIHPDTLNLPSDTRRLALEDGDYLLGVMTGGTDVKEKDGVTMKYDFEKFWLNETAPFLCNLPLLNSNAIPATTSHPEAALLFLDWMYSSQANQDLVLYGIEGQHWNPLADNKYERIKDADGKNLYAFDAWMIEYVPLHRWDVNDTSSEQDKIDYVSNYRKDNTVNSVMMGFNFNTEAVSVEYGNMLAEYTTSILPIKKGVLPYEGNFEAAMEKMRAAGCDIVIAEYQKQLAAYIASQK